MSHILLEFYRIFIMIIVVAYRFDTDKFKFAQITSDALGAGES